MAKGKERSVKRGIVFSILFVLAALSAARAGIHSRHVLNYPENYEGKTVVFDDTILGGETVRNQHYGFYRLDVEIQGKHIPGYLYRSQLNFVVFSEELSKKVNANLEGEKMEAKGHDLELLNHVRHKNPFPVRLTCIIERFRDYWVANVIKVEVYGKQGTIIKTIEQPGPSGSVSGFTFNLPALSCPPSWKYHL